MPLFVVRHQHSADRCPAQDPYRGASLLNYLSRPSVSKHGVRIQGEAVIANEHTFYLILEADDEAGLVVHRAHPLNCETSIPALIGGVVMPNARF